MALAAGGEARLDALSAGDEVLAADAEGALYYDTVSVFSLAQVTRKAPPSCLRTCRAGDSHSLAYLAVLYLGRVLGRVRALTW